MKTAVFKDPVRTAQ